MKNTFIKVCGLTVLVSFAAAVSIAQAQESETAEDSVDFNGFKTHALQFQVNDLLDVSSFQGGVLSYKYHFDNKNAVRVGFDVNGSDRDNDIDQKHTSRDTSFRSNGLTGYVEQRREEERNGESALLNLRVQSQYIRYMNPHNTFKVYGGVGPTFGYRKGEQESEVDEENERFSTYLDTTYEDRMNISSATGTSSGEQKRISPGLHLLLGIEWNPHENIGITVEYGYAVEYEYSESTYEERFDVHFEEQPGNEEGHEVRVVSSSSREHEWAYYSRPVKLGLTVYL